MLRWRRSISSDAIGHEVDPRGYGSFALDGARDGSGDGSGAQVVNGGDHTGYF